jgi:hypothetical protein
MMSVEGRFAPRCHLPTLAALVARRLSTGAAGKISNSHHGCGIRDRA